MRLFSASLVPVCAPLLLASGAALLGAHGDFDRQGQAPFFLSGLAVMFAGYLLAVRSPHFSPWLLWTVAAGLRLALLPMAPSDDLYRFVWEGRVVAHHGSPYLSAPDSPDLAPLRDELWKKVEFPDTTTIYPPLAEALFAIPAAFGGGLLAFKLVFAIADLLLCALLVRSFGRERALLYAWNPLAIYVFAGGGHYDSLFLLPLGLAWLAWNRASSNRHSTSAWLGAAIAIKWVAFPLLAWTTWRTLRSRGFTSAATALAAGAAPLLGSWMAACLWTGHWTLRLAPLSFIRYARSAEFIPAIVAALFPSTELLNQLYIAPVLFAWIVVGLRARRFDDAAEWFFFTLFLLSPMLHAWYFVWLLPFAVFTRNPGTVALTVTGSLYFWVYYRVLQPGGEWTFTWPERLIIWLPFIAGFLYCKTRTAIASPSRVE